MFNVVPSDDFDQYQNDPRYSTFKEDDNGNNQTFRSEGEAKQNKDGITDLFEHEEQLRGLKHSGQGDGDVNESYEDKNADLLKPLADIKLLNRSEKSSENEESKDSCPLVRLETKIYSCPGYKMHHTKISQTKDLSVKVLHSEVVDEGFFSAKYLSFKLKVLPWDTEIERRDKDFNSLREHLVKTNPHLLIPPLSDSKTIMKNDQWYLHKRKFIIENFVNKALSIPVLRSSDVFSEFLTLKSSKLVTKAIKAGADKTKVPEDASMYICETGEHPIIESKDVQKFSEKFTIYLNSYEVLNKEFYKLSRQLSDQYEEVSNTEKKLSE
jgi:hypothetical protein